MKKLSIHEQYLLWHKKNQSKGQVKTVKGLLEEQKDLLKKHQIPAHYTHNEGRIIIQYCGWSISLLDNGTWFWEDTTGG